MDCFGFNGFGHYFMFDVLNFTINDFLEIDDLKGSVDLGHGLDFALWFVNKEVDFLVN